MTYPSIYCGDMGAAVDMMRGSCLGVCLTSSLSLSPQLETAVITALVRASPQTCIMDTGNAATS